MNKKHVGDALDYWKGCVLKTAMGKKLSGLEVDPMITDLKKKWPIKEQAIYSSLLGLNAKNVHWRFGDLSSNRNNYFAEYNNGHPHDLFLDPDIGIEPPNSFDLLKHIRKAELCGLLRNDDDRLLILYQHANHEHDHFEQTRNTLRSLSTKKQKIHGCLLDCHQAAMVFLSRDKLRISDIVAKFKVAGMDIVNLNL